MKTYTPAPKHVRDVVTSLIKKFHPDLLKENVAIDLLYVRDDSDGATALSFGGYPAQAVVRVLSLKDRAAGRGDAEIVIDEENYNDLSDEQRAALLDHELYHLVLQTEGKGHTKIDSAGRPKLKCRKHDRQIGWFDEIARRHGDNSAEVMQARALIAEAGQTYFGFMKAERTKVAA